MAPAISIYPPFLVRQQSSCWLTQCFNGVSVNDPLGLCDNCKEALRG